jgi:aromatic-L-amino-acid decarboxylase
LAARIREACRLARLVADWIEADDQFELLAPVLMGVVCFRARALSDGMGRGVPGKAQDELNERLLSSINATGHAYLTHTRLRGQLALRIAVGNVLTTERHLAQVWDLVRLHRARLLSSVE